MDRNIDKAKTKAKAKAANVKIYLTFLLPIIWCTCIPQIKITYIPNIFQIKTIFFFFLSLLFSIFFFISFLIVPAHAQTHSRYSLLHSLLSSTLYVYFISHHIYMIPVLTFDVLWSKKKLTLTQGFNNILSSMQVVFC